ncbi:MAG: hypothetical protein ACFBZ8_14015 [Opitutales bacterium]
MSFLAQGLPAEPLELLEDTTFLVPTDMGWPWWGWLLAVLVCLGVGFLGYLIGRHGPRWLGQRRNRMQGPRPGVSPEDWALQQLRSLRGDLHEDRDYDFTIEVSRILRHYIEQRHGIFAPRMTTREFLRSATQWKPFPEFAMRSLEQFLSICDGSKFARKRVQEEQMRVLLDQAERFVRQSTPEAAPTADGNGNAAAGGQPAPRPLASRTPHG